MATPQQPLPVKLVISVLIREDRLLAQARTCLEQAFGAVDYASVILPFDHTHYYQGELGPQPVRQFMAFERLIDPGDLANVKLLTNGLEAIWSDQRGRPINLDPGYLTPAKLVLATTKDYAHRVYLGGGIYAEVALIYRKGDFCSLPWTYPDYASEPCLAIMRAIRAIHVREFTQSRASRLTPRSG